MSGVSISAVGLSKRYRSDAGPDGWLDALAEASFEVQTGDAVGLIGRNGAGKSTLLRILSRVTRPTAGYADIYGRVSALLEVGTGFHPELTGRENTFLSGAMLGMSREDVRRRFDEIVAFSEIGPFIDTPVKRYSSGMFARLGFAVAAHLLPDILIVDEVLAVGDLPFQAKCLARMHQLSETGTTLLFVSHNLLAVSDLCQRALVFERGRLIHDGSPSDAITTYRRLLADRTGRDGKAENLRVNGESIEGELEVSGKAPLRVDVPITRPLKSAQVPIVLNVVIEDPDGRPLIHLRSDHSGQQLHLHGGANWIAVTIDQLPLTAGVYSLWSRVVSVDPKNPLILDSERLLLHVQADGPPGAMLYPSHRFEQLRAASSDLAGVPR